MASGSSRCLQYFCSYFLLSISFLLFMAFWVALVYGHYYFGYQGGISDEYTCYAPNDKDYKVPWPIEEEIQQPPDNYNDVTHNFKMCARFGFYTYSAMVIIFTFLSFAKSCRPDQSTVMSWGAICLFPFSLVYLANLLFVMVYIWRQDGKICSGHFLQENQIHLIHEPKEPYLIEAGFFLQLAVYS